MIVAFLDVTGAYDNVLADVCSHKTIKKKKKFPDIYWALFTI